MRREISLCGRICFSSLFIIECLLIGKSKSDLYDTPRSYRVEGDFAFCVDLSGGKTRKFNESTWVLPPFFIRQSIHHHFYPSLPLCRIEFMAQRIFIDDIVGVSSLRGIFYHVNSGDANRDVKRGCECSNGSKKCLRWNSYKEILLAFLDMK